LYLLLPLAWPGTPAEAGELDQAEAVSELRVEVDELASELERERRRARDALSSLRLERADLERQLRLERVRAETLAQLEAERARELEALETEVEARAAPLREAVAAAEAHVDRTLPFRREARRRTLAQVRADLAALQPALADAFARVWRFVEEEAALGREVGLTEQPVTVGGERLLVHVARMSLALLYIRAPDSRVGWARKDGQVWRLEWVEAPAPARAIRETFEALEDNRTFGWHRLALPRASEDHR
jgi:multidrug efflux pump subunit AcrA (membrane-fusion protein)